MRVTSLPAYNNVRPDDEDASRLLIDSDGSTLEVPQLSGGERGVLAMVLDLARRLSQANPVLGDPLREGEAVVLIDELDLHLHPSWQRQIVHKLTEVFPRCQFIATTHSPQIIGEVEHDRIQIIANGQVIRNNRKGVLDAILQWLKVERARLQGPISRERLQREVDRRKVRVDELVPYSQVAAWWLQRRLARMS
jgi:predicted ATP-binding protein involved in virulence